MIVSQRLDEVIVEHYKPPFWKRLFGWAFPTYEYQARTATGVHIQKFVIVNKHLYSYGTLVMRVDPELLMHQTAEISYENQKGGNA